MDDSARISGTTPEPRAAEAPVVVLGVTGCIAAYKACELARALIKAGCTVKVVMTEHATHFVGPTTFRALTNQPVATELFDEPGNPIHHISLAEEADVFAIVPATANAIAKIATGRADDLLSTAALATEAPLVIAPAMNVHMWRDEATQENVAALRSRGATFVEPESGELACGDVGEGRLANVTVIAEAILAEVNRSRDLAGVRVLVTAGPTHEAIDPVRFIGNGSSGRTGFAIAEEAARRGASVTLVSGPVTLPDPFGVETIRVTSALEMAEAVAARYGRTDVVVASAAVSDFRPATPARRKLKKTEAPETIELTRNPDILAGLGAEKGERLLVGFAAETEDVLKHAAEKLEAKHLDLVVANDVSDPALGFGTATNRVTLVSREGAAELPEMSKTALARELWDRIAAQARNAAAAREGKA